MSIYKVSSDQEKKWAEEFEKFVARYYIAAELMLVKHDGFYEKIEIQFMYDGYMEARRKSQEEFSKFLEGEFVNEYKIRAIPGHVLFHSPVGYIHGCFKRRQWKSLRDLASKSIPGFFYNSGYEACLDGEEIQERNNLIEFIIPLIKKEIDSGVVIRHMYGAIDELATEEINSKLRKALDDAYILTGKKGS